MLSGRENEYFLEPARDEDAAVSGLRDVAGPEPAIRRQCLGRRLLILPVALHLGLLLHQVGDVLLEYGQAR